MNDLKIRLYSGILYALVVVLAITWGPLYFYPVLFIFSALATVEFYRLNQFSFTLPLLLVLGIYVAHYNALITYQWILFFLSFSLISCLLFVYRLWHPFKFNSKAIHQLIAMGHIVFSGFFIIAIYGNQSHFYPRLMLLVYLLIWVNNSGAYFVGSLWGKTPLFPSISPNKSWEGFWGGQFFCLIAGWAFYLLDSSFSHSPLLIICMSILIPSLATYGDLIQSQFKRIAGVKDSGRLFPGHGGFYDRMDSIIYAAPFIYLLIQITRYVS